MTKLERFDGPELGEDAQSLLRSVRASNLDGPPSGAKTRVRGAIALALAGGAGAVAGGVASAAGAQASAAGAVGAKAAIGSVAGTVSAGAVATGAGATTAASSTAAATTAVASTTAATAAGGLFSGLAAKVAIAAIAVSAVGGVIAVNRPAPAPVSVAAGPEVLEETGDPPASVRASTRRAEAALPPVEPPAVAELAEPTLEPVLEPAVEVPTAVVPTLEAAARSLRIARPEETPEVVPSEPPSETSSAMGASAPLAAAPTTLMEEMSLLAPGHRALARGDAAAALRTARAHRARFPAGEQVEDAESMEVRALCLLHDPGAAEARARFEAAHPSSVYAASIRTACR